MSNNALQLPLFQDIRKRSSKPETSGSFVNNMTLPVHRWFRYSAGFSAVWASSLIADEADSTGFCVFDPFAGSGTTLISAEQCGVKSIGIEPHPFVSKVARAKLAYRSSKEQYLQIARAVLSNAKKKKPSLERYSLLIRKCYSNEALEQLDQIQAATNEIYDGSESTQLVWLTMISILRPTSHVGTANWQYLLPKRRKAKVSEPFLAFKEMTDVIYQDMSLSEGLSGPKAVFNVDDARECKTIPDDSCNLVVTSPPYPNNYDYADATRLELAFLREIDRWGDLQEHVRKHLLRSCTQHVPDSAVNIEYVLDSNVLIPIKDELQAVCNELGQVRLNRGGKKTYHNMIACYFLDLAMVWNSLRRVCKSPSKICFVIGDSAPYGVYVPVIEWFSKLATSSGFGSCSFEKIRDRNVKWKNRKHRVPLCEGRFWTSG